MLNRTSLTESFGAVVFDSAGKVKDTRFVKAHFGVRFEFIPNRFYLTLINSGRIQPNTWKVPFLFGTWKAYKETH